MGGSPSTLTASRGSSAPTNIFRSSVKRSSFTIVGIGMMVNTCHRPFLDRQKRCNYFPWRNDWIKVFFDAIDRPVKTVRYQPDGFDQSDVTKHPSRLLFSKLLCCYPGTQLFAVVVGARRPASTSRLIVMERTSLHTPVAMRASASIA